MSGWFFFIFMQPDKAPPIISSRTTSPRVRFTHKYGSVLVSVAAWTPAGSTVEATLSNFLASFDFSTFLLRPFLTRVTEPWTGIVETGLIRLTLQPTGGKRQSYTNCVNVVVYDIRGVGGEDWQCTVIYDVWMRDKGEGKLSFVGAHCHIQTSRNTFSTPSVMVFCFVLLIIRQRDWTWYSQTLMILDLLFWQETPHFSRRRKRRRSHKQQLFSAAGIKSAPNALAECTNFHSLLKEVITVILFCSFSAGCFSLLACRSVSDENLLPFSSNAKHSHLSIRFNSKVSVFSWLRRIIHQNISAGEDWRFMSRLRSYRCSGCLGKVGNSSVT